MFHEIISEQKSINDMTVQKAMLRWCGGAAETAAIQDHICKQPSDPAMLSYKRALAAHKRAKIRAACQTEEEREAQRKRILSMVRGE